MRQSSKDLTLASPDVLVHINEATHSPPDGGMYQVRVGFCQLWSQVFTLNPKPCPKSYSQTAPWWGSDAGKP